MADSDKKRSPLTIAILAGKAKDAKSGDDEKKDEKDGGESDPEMGLDSAAEEILSAVKDGDSEALKDALKSFVHQCYED